MKTRFFSKEALQISEIGLGTWQLGSDWRPIDEKVALTALKAAFETGVNFFR